jgi:hypothetical protein
VLLGLISQENFGSTQEKKMVINEDVHMMREQILRLRTAGIAWAGVIRHLPRCATSEGCPVKFHKFPETRDLMQLLGETAKKVLLLTRTALDAVFQSDAQRWDCLYSTGGAGEALDRLLAEIGESLFSDQDEFIRSWGEIDDEMMEQLGTTFSDEEWRALTAKGAWQNGHRLPQIIDVLTHVEHEIAEGFDFLDSVLDSGMLKVCSLGNCDEKKEAARA